MKRKRSFYNIAIGLASQILSIALGIVIPRLFLLNYGSEVNGFLNTVTQIFVYFSLLEAGVGATTLQALYGPVSKNCAEDINSILAATDRYYKRTGKIYALAVLLLATIYPLVLHSEMSFLTMFLIILFNGIPGVISYYFQGKFLILLQAEGKSYINTALMSITNTAISIAKIVLMLIGFDVLAVQLCYLIISLLKVLIIALYIKKKYSWIDIQVVPNYKAIEQKNSAFIMQICDLIFRNTDTIILSLFCDLKVVSVYAMYTLLFSMVRTVLDYVSQGFSFIMGQAFNTDIEKFKRLNDLYETYRMALTYALFNIAYVFILPFMKLYTSGVNDINYLDNKVALLFVIYYLMTASRANEAEMINYAQHFKLTQTRCIIEAVINLGVSLISVYFLGIYGVLIGTIVALLYRLNDMVLYANHRILHRSAWVTYKRIITNSVTFALISIASASIPWSMGSYLSIIGFACLFGVISILIYFTIASLTNRNEFCMLLKYVKPFGRKVKLKLTIHK